MTHVGNVVKAGTRYAPNQQAGCDWGLREYLAYLAGINPGDIGKVRTLWDGYAGQLTGSNGVVAQVEGAVKNVFQNNVQNNFQGWTGAGANAYQTHSQRVIDYGGSIADVMSGNKAGSLGKVLMVAQAALQTAKKTFDSTHPATWAEAFQETSAKYRTMVGNTWRQYAAPGDNNYEDGPVWNLLNQALPKLAPKDPDLWTTDQFFVDPQNPDTNAYNQCFLCVWMTARDMNQARCETVCNALNTLVDQYVKIYQQLPSVPTPPPTANNKTVVTPPPPQYPTTPAKTPVGTPNNPVSSNSPNSPNSVNSPNSQPPGGGSLNSPTSTAGLTSPTSTAGVTTPNSTLTGTSMPTGGPATSYPTVPGLDNGITPTVNPDLGHLTTAAGFGTPLAGAGGLGGGLGRGGLGTPKGIGGVGTSGLGQAESGVGGSGPLGSSLPDAAAMEAAEAGAANAANGRGGMPVGGAGAGGKGNSKDRTRGVYLPEDEDVWGVQDGVAPPVIGGSW